MKRVDRRTCVLAGLGTILAVTGCAGVSPTSLATMVNWGQKGKKAYEIQQKLQKLNFTIRSDPSQGETVFVASIDVKRVPVAIAFDISNVSQPARSVTVAEMVLPLAPGVSFSIGVANRASLVRSGIAAETISEIETTVNSALEAVASVKN